MSTPRIAKKFQIEELTDREITEQLAIMKKHEVTGHVSMEIVNKTRVVAKSYMVYFPAGHSIWVETKEDLQRLGLIESANSEIDLETGLPVEPPRTADIKALVQRKTQQAVKR